MSFAVLITRTLCAARMRLRHLTTYGDIYPAGAWGLVALVQNCPLDL